MLPYLLECAIRSLLVATGTAAVLWLLRIRRASVQHTAWTAVMLTMLALPLWSAAGPKITLRVLGPVTSPIGSAFDQTVISVNPSLSSIMTATPQPAPSDPESGRQLNWTVVLIVAYVVGVSLLLARLIAGTMQADRFRRCAVIEAGRPTSGRCATPITVGWFSPMLILPRGWQRWPEAQLNAVLTHEAEHARRRDPLVQWMALFNRAIFWFHPLAWWLERRLAILAEEACDAAVLGAGHSSQDYSKYLLDFARSVKREGRRVAGMAMPGSGLRTRLRQILDGPPVPPVSQARLAGTAVLWMLSAVLGTAATIAPRQQIPPAAATPKFEVASVKPCVFNPTGRGAGPSSQSPGRLMLACQPLSKIIDKAYLGSGLRDGNHTRMEGVPAWANSALYEIEAKADGTPSTAMMRGLMLQGLLEDRFKLKIHRETREIPVYALTVAAGGPKLHSFSDDAECVTYDDPNRLPPPPRKPPCGIPPRTGQETVTMPWIWQGKKGPNRTFDALPASLDEFSMLIGSMLDRPIFNRTGITGMFDIHLDFAPEGTSAPADPGGEPATAPSIFTAIQEQLGLKLVPARGPHEFFVVDHVERPSPDGLAPAIDHVDRPHSGG